MKFGLLGRKLGHSWSAPIHHELGCESYRLIELEPEELDGLQPLELHAGEGLRLSPADLKCLEPLVHFVDLGGEE